MSKKFLVSSLLLVSVMFANSDEKQCPDLSIKTDNMELSIGIKEGLEKSLVTSKEIYIDILKAYNKTENVDEYITQEGLEEVAASVIWAKLYVQKSRSSDSESEKKYKQILASIDKNNEDWCK